MKEEEEEEEGIVEQEEVSWHEVARPQIHGYDMQCIAMLSSVRFVSGADEKVLRVFEAPSVFLENLASISHLKEIEEISGLSLGASAPSLGLSNKAVTTEAEVIETEEIPTKNSFADHIPAFAPVKLTRPPIEDHLMQNTLWPEIHKLYGHGYEVFCVASSPDGKLIASACKASKLEYASVIIWDTSKWKQVASLTHHSLTVTQMAFSPSGLYLLAVSRDRCWSLWKQQARENGLFELAAHTDKNSKTHSRIIWSCAWSHDSLCFATASRDKKVIVWSQPSKREGGGGREEGLGAQRGFGEGWSAALSPLECSSAVTAISFAPRKYEERYMLAVGLESGALMIHTCQISVGKWESLVDFVPSFYHSSAVKRLQWRPCEHEASCYDGSCSSLSRTCARAHTQESHQELLLVSCGVDHAVKLFAIKLC